MFRVKNIPVHHPDYAKYPSSDGELMAETSKHLDWILKIKGNLDALTEGQDIFVGGDLLWYPVEGRADICKAPDGMVAIGRPKGDRDTYLQWLEDNVPPQVVFEIFSRTNHRRLNKENLLNFYTRYGVQEYYSYDPIKNVFVIYLRQGDKLIPLEGLQKWTSPLLGIHFEWNEKTFEIYYPNGEPFLSFEELSKHFKAEKTLRRLEVLKWQEAVKYEQLARQEADMERQKAEAERQKAEAEAQKAEAAQTRQKLLEEKLRELGIDPNAL